MEDTTFRDCIDEGEAFARAASRPATAAPIDPSAFARPEEHAHGRAALRERFDVVVVGGGQAGLSVGYFLARRGLCFVILDASARIGDPWRRRWDSLRLFTPARYDGLAGMPFPAPPTSFPTKDQMADYLESYAARFELPVRSGTKVERISKHGDRYLVRTDRGELEAAHVVVAMASFQKRRVPSFASELRPGIVQVHSSDYRNPSQLGDGAVLVAGAGNSGAELALELAKNGRETFLSGRDTGHVPFRIEGFWGRNVLARIVLRFLFHYVLTIETPIGRKARPAVMAKGGPLIRVKPKDLRVAGVSRVPRIAGVKDGLPVLEDGRVLDVQNVLWCTGFSPGFDWIDLPIFDDAREPLHEGGVVPSEPGFYFVGLHFLYSMSSTMVHGVARDAERIASVIAARNGVAI